MIEDAFARPFLISGAELEPVYNDEIVNEDVRSRWPEQTGATIYDDYT